MIITVTNEVPFQILSSSFSIGPSQTGYELQVGADSRSFSTLFSVGANTPRMVTNVANGSYFRLKNNVGDVKVNWQRVCVTEGGGSGSGTELTPVTEFPLGAAEGTVVALASGDTVGLYQYIDDEWVLVGADDPTKLLAVNELPASAETGTVMALYQEGEAGGGTWEWDEASEEYVFNCNFSTLDTAATYDLGNPLGSDVSGSYHYANINLHYDNGWKVSTILYIEEAEIDENTCELQGGEWECRTTEEETTCRCKNNRSIVLSPSTDPNNGFESEDICYDYDENTDEETERWIDQRFYWDPADLKLKYVMNDGDMHYRYDCSGVPDLRNITGGTPSEPILGLYQYDGTAWNKVIDLSAYWTSAQTEDAISASTAGKADAANVTANNNFQTFARWNSQGVITGAGNTAQDKAFDINGARFKPLSFETANWPRIWAPLSAGTAGEVLVSTGNGAPVWSAMTFPTPDVDKAYVDSAITEVQEQIDTMDDVVSAALVDLNDTKVGSADVKHIVKLTQAEYDALTDKDPYTFYIIISNS